MIRSISRQKLASGVLLGVIVLFIGSYLKLRYWTTSDPASGGDTGSHFFPLEVIVRTGKLRNWNPGNLFGEPQLVHYFPFSFWLMAFLAKWMPTGMAFNWGQLLALFFFPLSIYQGLRWLGHRSLESGIAALFAIVFFFNESYSAWGGNFASTLAGQFSHLYALCFLFLAIGRLRRDLRREDLPWGSLFLFSALMLCHSYVFMVVPAFFFSLLFFSMKRVPFIRKIRDFAFISIGTTVLTAYWWFPMIQNSPWMTAYGSAWMPNVRSGEYLPWVFWPYFLTLGLLPFSWRLAKRRKRTWRLPQLKSSILFWIIPSLFYLVMVKVFPKVGLVDIRAVPQIQLFILIICAIWVSHLIHELGREWRMIGVLVLTAAVLVQVLMTTRKVPQWLPWNYDGWKTKQHYPAAKQLYQTLFGNFDQGRVVYEHSDINNGAGSPRVFEMLPHFSGRATLESLYMQATILAPVAYYMQALVSERPSCPFPNFPCPRFDLGRAEQFFPLLGVSDLILVTPKVREQLPRATDLEQRQSAGPWTLHHFQRPIRLVDGFLEPPEVLPPDVRLSEVKKRFFDWFIRYRPEQGRFLVSSGVDPSPLLQRAGLEQWKLPEGCQPELSVKLNELVLKTPCPGRAHWLKFAYNPGMVADSGDPLFLVSPGFIGIFPSQSEVRIQFGERTSWRIAGWISGISLLLALLFWLGRSLRRFLPLRRGPSLTPAAKQ